MNHYNIHNLLSITSEIPLDYSHDMAPDFSCFGVSHITDPSITIVVLSTNLSTKGMVEVARGVFISPTMVVSKLFGMVWGISDLGGHTTVYVNEKYLRVSKLARLPISSMMPWRIFLRSLVQLKLLEVDASWLVAAGLVLGNRSIIVTGGIGSGKTTTLVRLMEEPQALFLSSNLLLVKGSTVYGFPAPMSVRWIDMGFLSLKRPKLPHWPIKNSMELPGELYLLAKSEQYQTNTLTQYDMVNVLTHLNQKVHPYRYERVLSWATCLTPGLLDKERDILSTAIIGCSCKELCLSTLGNITAFKEKS